MKNIIFVFVLFFFGGILSAQSGGAAHAEGERMIGPLNFIGLEFQAYPTGLIPGVTYIRALGRSSEFAIRVGYNRVRHGDLGVHDDERGGGMGISLGYQKNFAGQTHGFFAGVRSDVWFNTIDWKDTELGNLVQGTTTIVVLQPTASVGYSFPIGLAWVLRPAISFGAEINVVSHGADVGQGMILLGGISLLKRLGP